MNERNTSKFQRAQQVGGGRFRLERPVGQGGMGEVWEAFDKRLNEPVALKFFAQRIREDPVALESMRRETSRCHSLSHHHIVRIHDLYEGEGEAAFISMEFVVGKNLHDLAGDRPGRAFSLEEVWRWTRQLCAALAYAHSRGVVHRDLKPANVILNGAGELKLADFGLAAALRDPASVEEEGISGTPAYMSPQQFAGAPPAVSDDIYSLGACLFELLAGVPAFKGPELRRKIEFEPAPLLSAVMAERGLSFEIPEAFEDLLQQCLSKNPLARPASADAFLKLATAALAKADDPSEGVTLAASKRPFSRLALAASLILIAAIFIFKPRRAAYLDLRSAPVRASSFTPDSFPNRAFDGLHRDYDVREAYRWASGVAIGDASEWIAVDLGKDMRLGEVVIDWELAYAKNFTVRTRTSDQGWSDDPAQWTERGKVLGFVEKTHGAVNAVTNILDVTFDFRGAKVRLGNWMNADRTEIEKKPFVARHVMINATTRGLNNPGVYSIHEIEIAAKPAR